MNDNTKLTKSRYFLIKVREGVATLADKEKYTSKIYDSYEQCFNEYIKFSKRWYDIL